MATYLIKEEITITRQAGDTADIVFNVPSVLSMTGKTVKFQVRNNAGTVVITKSTPDTITLLGQIITIPLLSSDTINRSEMHRWELEVSDEDEIYTIGKGIFMIIKTEIA